MLEIADRMSGAFDLLKEYAKRNPKLKAVVERIRNKRYFSEIHIHELMLGDQPRVDAYYKAIRKHVAEGDVVVDLGTGTGILSFFAAQQNPRHIYAIDHSHIIKMAKHLAEENSIDNITFLQVNSRQFAPNEKIDVILHEQMGSELFNEYMIPNICDLRDRLLAKNGRIIPHAFNLFLEPVCLKDTYAVPFLWERDLHGVRLNSLKRWLGHHKELKASLQRRIYPFEVDRFLCEPESIYSLDLYTAQPGAVAARWQQRKPVVRSGPMDGFCLYFNVPFDDEISLDNSPFSKPTNWRCHLIRTEQLQLNEGDVLEVDWEIGDLANVHSWRPNYRRLPKQPTPQYAAEVAPGTWAQSVQPRAS